MTTDLDLLHEAVRRNLVRVWPDADLVSLERAEGGNSGLTLLAEVRGTPRGAETLIVKAAPPGRPAVGRHDVARQARAIGALAAVDGVPVPRLDFVAEEPPAIAVMEKCAGDAVEPILEPPSMTPPAAVVRERALTSARILAALHTRAPVPRTVDDAEEPEVSVADELSRWSATAASAGADLLPDGGRLAEALGKAMPEPVPSCLVHGDFRLGNVIFDGVHPTGVIDWEIWGRTDPGIDLGWYLTFCDPDLFPGSGTPVVGLPSADELFDAYLDAGGRKIADRPFYEAFGQFKMAAIMAHNLRRHREGRRVDPFQEKLPPTIARLVESGIEKLG